MQWIPFIVPSENPTIYIVEDDLGKLGRAYRETGIVDCDRESTIAGLIAGHFEKPLRVIAFNTAERWSQDVSEDIAREIKRRHDETGEDVPSTAQAFIDAHLGGNHDPALRLV